MDARTASGGEKKVFATQDEAKAFADKCRVKRKNEGNSAFDDSELAQYGWSVADAIRYALAHLRQQAESKPVADAVAALVEFKRGRVGEIRLSDIENRLKKFSDSFEGKTLSQIVPDEIVAFLASFSHPTTRNDYRKEVIMLWHFAKDRKWVAEPLNKALVPREKEPSKSRIILTVDQAKKLMLASTDNDVRALNALVLFGGLRREEVEKLDWSHVNFRTGRIEVSAEISKVARERFSPMTANLRAWLAPIAKRSGPIVERELMHVLRATWNRAGTYPWPQDAHRHSFISYRRRLIGDAQTAIDAGTSETIIKEHYKRPVTLEDAEKFFAIMPSSSDATIVSISAG